MKTLRTIAYAADKKDWSRVGFADHVFMRPDFVSLERGDLVLALDLVKPDVKSWSSYPAWGLKGLHRVNWCLRLPDSEEYRLELVISLSERDYIMTGSELLGAFNWIPHPDKLFKRLPFFVWNWLCDTKGVPFVDA